MSEPEAPKIIVDSDWKSQAKAEKERLEAAEKASASKKPAEGGVGAGLDAVGEEGLPEANVQTLIGTLVTQAILYMGGFPDPQTGRAIVSLEHAKFHIDLLAVFEEKTRGNLTEGETQDLVQTLNELRLRFVEISRAVAAAMAKQGARGAGGPAGPVVPGGGPPGLRLS